MFYLLKANVKRGNNAKTKKEVFAVKASSVIFADSKVTSELTPVDSSMVVTDINLKGYVEIFTIEGDGPFYDVSLEFEDVDGKTLKENYLQQANGTAEAEAFLLENLGNPAVEIVNTKKTNIIDYFIGE